MIKCKETNALRDESLERPPKKICICDQCSKPFSSTDLLSRHIANVHAKEKKFKCETCGKGFGVRSNFNAHVAKVHGATLKLPCEFCGKVLSDMKSLRSHVMSKHKRDECPFQCEICQKKFPRNSHLVRHVGEVHKNERTSQVFQCDHCEEKFWHRVLLDDHLKKHHFLAAASLGVSGSSPTAKRFPCEFCGRNLFDAKSLRLHILSKHKREECPFQCDVCGKKFPRNSVLARHVSQVHKDLVECDVKIKEEFEFLNCFQCPKVFLSAADYQAHECNDVFPLDDDDERFKCDSCDKRYMRPSSLRRHVREEHSEPMIQKIRGLGHVCQICQQTFDQSYHFKLHMKKAHENAEIVPKGPNSTMPKAMHHCEFCSKAFFRKESIRRHVREVHEEASKKGVSSEWYACGQCEKKYERKDVLRRHVRLVHEAVQAGNCDLCNGAFFRDLSRHMIVSHTNPRNEVKECPLCSKSIGKHYSLARHIRVFHDQKEQEEKKSSKLCDICGSCQSKGDLECHKRDAPGINGHRKSSQKQNCSHCDKVLSGRHSLKVHIATVHEKRKDYMCTECGRCFSQLISLQTHVKHVHFGQERAFPCKHCAKVFNSPRGRHLHVEKAHKMQCASCHQLFAFKKHLDGHQCK